MTHKQLDEAWKVQNITATQKFTLICLAHNADKHGVVTMPYSEIANTCGMKNNATACRNVNQLAALGLLKKRPYWDVNTANIQLTLNANQSADVLSFADFQNKKGA